MEKEERGTGNGERGTGNGERGTGNGERGTGNGSLEGVYSGNSPEDSKWRRKRRLQTLILFFIYLLLLSLAEH